MAEKQVKGTMFMDNIRMIRANKNLKWDQYLEAKDWEYINSLILPGTWYPFEVYQRCGWAAYKLLAGENLELVRLNGRLRGKEFFGAIYKSIIASKKPIESLKKFVASYGAFFNFSSLKFEKVSEKHARVFHEYDATDQANVPYCHQMMGYFDTLCEMTGAKNPQIELSAKQWEGAPFTIFEIKWE